MHDGQEPQQAVVGSFDFEVYGSGRGHRTTCSRFKLRCDAIALYGKEMLLLSVTGSETSVKALTAGLRSSGRDQKRIEYTVHLQSVNETLLTKCHDGYRIYRAKMKYGLWHVLCLAQRDGFMPAITDEAIWQILQTPRFTTPLLRSWVPWLRQEMTKREILVPVTQVGCEAGLMLVENEMLDDLVSQGVKQRRLLIKDGHGGRTHAKPTWPGAIRTLDGYLTEYGPLLAQQAERSLEPLHVPGREPVPALDLMRTPFEAQSHVIAAAEKALRRQKSLLLVGEMGTGKSIMGLATVHGHAKGQPYRALIFCPGQLNQKWEREIRETIPDAEVIHIEGWKTLLPLYQAKKPTAAHWYIVARDRAKLGAKWCPAYQIRKHMTDGFVRCPQCGRRLVNEKREPILVGTPGRDGQPGTGLWKRRSHCEYVLSDHESSPSDESQGADRLVEGCGSPLWQMTGELRRYEPALFIKRRLRNAFDYLVIDEVHEEKGANTAQGHAAAALAASCRKVIALTGTVIGGYAEHLRPLLFRLSPATLVNEGLGWSDTTAFNERYGRIETRITERSKGRNDCDNRMSRGSKTTIKLVRPGIMPPLFGRHLIDKCVFLSLNEVAHNLPPFTEECVPVRMDKELATAYRKDVEEPLVETIKQMMKRQDRRLLGTMLQTLLAYPDYPWGWEPVGYMEAGRLVTVATPPNLTEDTIRPKEQALIDLVNAEKAKKRQVWVYVQFTDRHDVEARLDHLLTKAGFRVAVLRSTVPLARREEWITKNAPNLDVVISHPRLVETGLDLFDKGGRHNFSTICFYECGYNLFTLRQASRRSWRIGQNQECRVIYLYYQRTMQDRAIALMGKKLMAAQALEGKFSSEGLAAMAGEDATMEVALARSLVERLDEGDARRLWSRVTNPAGPTAIECPSVITERRMVVNPAADSQSLFDFLTDPQEELPIRRQRMSRISPQPAGRPQTNELWLF